MGKVTGISWCHSTFNLWWGCVEVSPACDHSYAARDAKRYGWDIWGADKPRRFFKEKHQLDPLKWQREAAAAGEMRRVFCGSFMDIGERHTNVETATTMDMLRLQLFTEIIPQTPNLIWLLLTKRPWGLVGMVPAEWQRHGWPRNVWPGTTAENQEWYDARINSLSVARAANSFISYEPTLGFIDFKFGGVGRGVTWVISGGESGHHYRPEQEDHHRSARDQCADAGRAYWFKQHSGLHPKLLGDELDGRKHHDVPLVGA